MLEANKKTGAIGEEKAVQYLKKKKIKIVCKNYRGKTGEIDIIAKKGSCYIFVEVKTRRQDRFGSPAEAVTFSKQKQISRVALEYITLNKLHDEDVRFDVIAVTLNQEKEMTIEHFENAFDFIQ